MKMLKKVALVALLIGGQYAFAVTAEELQEAQAGLSSSNRGNLRAYSDQKVGQSKAYAAVNMLQSKRTNWRYVEGPTGLRLLVDYLLETREVLDQYSKVLDADTIRELVTKANQAYDQFREDHPETKNYSDEIALQRLKNIDVLIFEINNIDMLKNR
jgi:hypothetical protein